MDTRNPSAPSRAQSRSKGKNHPPRRPDSGVSGVVHKNVRLTTRFTVIDNGLAQHPDLGATAIGLGAYIQSLPNGAQVDIKTLAARFHEGATRIAAGLRELEEYGYLSRTRERTSTGRIITRTVSFNRPRQPGEEGQDGEEPERTDDRPARTAPSAPSAPEEPRKRAPRKPLPAVPQPAYKGPGLLEAATELLVGLRRHDPDLLLSACDTAHLAPGVAAWLERDVSATAVRHALLSDLPPEGMRRPAAFLAHRLINQLPPPAPFRAPAAPPAIRHPLQNCDRCDRAFRGPERGQCRECRISAQVTA
ncbi:helix-turn-helix domain-containing protein [Streptomyces geranii]|uniref:helix-turn-helix domain-containing protein n=1 Tax=Streptomyces geranii TaxID=2058923 RepID=UPI000D040493|nr:helix-turn-helix domain-containing protein [Streptomyces geranii]